MPKKWYDYHTVKAIEDDDERAFQKSILAEYKPYFMRYIYPQLMKDYNSYVSIANKSSLRNFGMSIDELKGMPLEELTDDQQRFIYYYDMKMPVGLGDCVMNKICRLFENEFDGYLKGVRSSKDEFNYTIYKANVAYTQDDYEAVNKLLKAYQNQIKDYKIFMRYERVEPDEYSVTMDAMREDFRRSCEEAVQNEEELCDIMLDLCYQQSSTKYIVWSLFADVICSNMLKRNGYVMTAPMRDANGDIRYGGERFSLRAVEIGGNADDSDE